MAPRAWVRPFPHSLSSSAPHSWAGGAAATPVRSARIVRTEPAAAAGEGTSFPRDPAKGLARRVRPAAEAAGSVLAAGQGSSGREAGAGWPSCAF